MRGHQEGSPLPPDSPGREDVMSQEPEEPREPDAVPGAAEGSPLRRDDGPEDVLREEPRDGVRH